MTIRKYALLLMGVCCVLLLTGCPKKMKEPLPTVHFTVQTPAHRQAELRKILFWRVNGVFSMQQLGFEKRKPNIANYQWVQLGPYHYEVTIASMLDLYHLLIIHRKNSVTLWKNAIHVYHAKTAQGLMYKTVGWSLPISQMRYWLMGMPSRDKNNLYYAHYDKYGHLITLRQNGWTINYGSYKTQNNGVDFPQVILMQRPGLDVKIIAAQWTLLTYQAPAHDALVVDTHKDQE